MPRRFSFAHVGRTWPATGPASPRAGKRPSGFQSPRHGPTWRLSAQDKKAAAFAVESGCAVRGDSEAPHAPVVEVAVEQAALVEKLSDRGNVARAVQDGHFGADEAPDGFQHIGIMQVGRAPDDLGEVVGDEDRGVAVLLFVRIAGQPDDAVVRDAHTAVDIQRLHHLALI